MHNLCLLIVLPVALLPVLLFDYFYPKFPYARAEAQQLFVLHFDLMEYQVEEVLRIIARFLAHHLYDLGLQLILQPKPFFLRFPQLLANLAELPPRHVRKLELIVYDLLCCVHVLIRVEQIGYEISVLLL